MTSFHSTRKYQQPPIETKLKINSVTVREVSHLRFPARPTYDVFTINYEFVLRVVCLYVNLSKIELKELSVRLHSRFDHRRALLVCILIVLIVRSFAGNV